jgi:cytochrome d ubiquinol oxidase subunit I
VAGISAYLLLKDKDNAVARKAMPLAMGFAFVCSIFELFPIGHHHAQKVAKYQPEKLAAFEGLYDGGPSAPLTLFGIPTKDGLVGAVKVPGLLSVLVGNSTDTVVQGLNDFPADERPPVLVTFLSFHGMVGLGTLFILVSAVCMLELWRKRLFENRWLLWTIVLMVPLTVLASELGWITAEVGRQPWAVYRLLRTTEAVSISVHWVEILISLIMFTLIYALLGALYIFLIVREVKLGPQPVPVKESNND